jgi:hypothetical protein
VRVAALLLAGVAFAASAESRFADAEGFSGMHGVTCVSCHFPETVELGTAAQVLLEGVPAAWDAGTSYALRVEVRGGPPANPIPGTPQAGFDIETDGGGFVPVAAMEGYVRLPSRQEATYTGLGTTLRAWDLTWEAPTETEYPRNVTFFLAAIAANGNHLMGGPNVTGERGDRATAIVRTIPPSEMTWDRWNRLPIEPPRVFSYAPPEAGGSSVLTGEVPSFADGAEVRIDAGNWRGATGAPGFSFPLPPWSPGPHVVEIRTVWGLRVSEPVLLAFNAPGFDSAVAAPQAPSHANAAVFIGIVLAILAVPIVPLIRRMRG